MVAQKTAQLAQSLRNTQPISYTYFLQPNLDNSYVLNKVFSGYGRMFSKFQSDDNVVNIKNMHRNSLEHLEEEVKYLDLYGIYGFNANVHQTVTDYILDIENIWGGYELKDLSLAVDFERKELSFYLENKRVFPITLGAISSRMLPLFHRFLCDVNHIDSMDLDLNRRFIYSDWYELSSDKIKFIPRVKAKDIILARNKWLINLSRYNSLKDESKFYSELIRDIEANLIPGEFYVKPIDVKEISNVEQMNDFFKPQFINMKLITSYKLMYRIAKKCNFLLLEESKPNSLEKEKYPGDFKGATTEIGVESYFVQLENN
ncbi:lantibiotic dehydratase family protein [Virgibacillus pantothenticus]|uniref:lantibiotic dehydratase n=1 Tax=Virgibacillus pantothenticus TaxID=1473 RepID=UPI001C24F96B|nr:lantibiotic dehydratase [Virgibacillus pantothenticus]MBU8567676.1 lantibiotic dehydratase family protein [Virgibacillus pantothenticus]MBU8602066.1 lantibiotic dehydratase family protein [Virgibacillus pantothenticus]MBU8635703.1 lantibiotic dehydratase family protein [Virgibacillus pantothenticus]MBU8648218.1 lantibiotic dehydratase family protein [Virgibacillus pantothenticus]MBU8666334.1 lantibiotic dehydratase family protein [Virgibacillus pantothenticus]